MKQKIKSKILYKNKIIIILFLIIGLGLISRIPSIFPFLIFLFFILIVILIGEKFYIGINRKHRFNYEINYWSPIISGLIAGLSIYFLSVDKIMEKEILILNILFWLIILHGFSQYVKYKNTK